MFSTAWLRTLRDAYARRHTETDDRVLVASDVGGWVFERDRSKLSKSDEVDHDQKKPERTDQLNVEEVWPTRCP